VARSLLASECEAIYRETLAELSASRLVGEALRREELPAGPLRVLALGKAAAAMAEAAVAALGGRVRDPLCVLPEGQHPPADVRWVAGSHPRPSERSLEAGRRILDWAEGAAGSPALVLVSGGASAVAVVPVAGVPFEDKASAVALLMAAGATIQELNAVRKHLSRLKGGRLGLALGGAPVLVLVLSDVPGDDLSVIGSGPLVPDPSTFAEALRVVQRCGAEGRLPASVRDHLLAGARGERDETPKPGDPRFERIRHRLLAGPVQLARTAAAVAARRGFEAEAEPAAVTGDVADLAARVGRWVRLHAGRGRRLLAIAGEPTVRIPAGAASPSGGRAQHLALLAALEIAGAPAAFLAAGSDGRDGPTDQAGAVVDGETARAAAAAGVDVAGELGRARSGPAVVTLGAAIPRLETGTHLCDLHLVAVA
jgi:hydroxypyruvate reductase